METVELSGQLIVGTLVSADRGRRTRQPSLVRVLPYAIAIGNIVLLAYFERYLGEPPDRQALLLVLFLQSIQVLGFSFLRLSGPVADTLRKTAIFPVPPPKRYLFALRSVLGDRNLIALWGGTVISILILAASTPMILFWTFIAYAALSSSLIGPLCAAILWQFRRSTPFSTLGWGMGITCAGVLAGVLLFRIPSLLEGFFPVAWAADIILGAAVGDPFAAGMNFVPLALIAAASVAGGRRIS